MENSKVLLAFARNFFILYISSGVYKHARCTCDRRRWPTNSPCPLPVLLLITIAMGRPRRKNAHTRKLRKNHGGAEAALGRDDPGKRANIARRWRTIHDFPTEDIEDIDGLDLSWSFRDSVDFVPPVNFGAEWDRVDRDMQQQDATHKRQKRFSWSEEDSVDSLEFTESASEASSDCDPKAQRSPPVTHPDPLVCHETQTEYPPHGFKLSQMSMLDLLALKHATACSARSLKIQIEGGIIGERFSYLHDEDGIPVPSYVNCAGEPGQPAA